MGKSKKTAIQTRIFGGDLANYAAWPWHTVFRYFPNGQNFCGGSILNEDYVLTAAHCFTATGEEIQDVFADLKTDKIVQAIFGIWEKPVGEKNHWWSGVAFSSNAKRAGLQARFIREVRWHQEYDHVKVFNDIAIARTHAS